MSRYKSDDPAIQKALRQTNTLVAIPFFVLLFTFMFGGMYLFYYLNLPAWTNVIAIFGGLGLTGLISHWISIYWFKKHLPLVENKGEFTRRAIRLQMMIPRTARRIAAPYLSEDERTEFETPKNVDFGNGIQIHSGKFYTEKYTFQISEIDNFSMKHVGTRGSLRGTSYLYIHLIKGTVYRVMVPSSIVHEVEYELDKQIEYFKKDHSTFVS